MIVFLGVLLLVAAGGQQYYFFRRRRRLAARSWESVLADVELLDFKGVSLVADCYLQPSKDQLRIEPPLMWELIGGSEGLKSIKANAKVILELAVYAQRWNKEEALIVSEAIRLDAMRVIRSATRLERSLLISGFTVQAPFRLQEAVSSYCLMRGRLFGLYENSHIALLPQLQAAF